ncbi:MAG: hypothetical protein ACRCUS_10245 [Anaerovoracaceae bacterium]
MGNKSLDAARWTSLSLAEQMGNIGSEVSRANRWLEICAHLYNFLQTI